MKQLHKSTATETKAEKKARIKRIFETFDEDGNGTIEEHEFINGMGNYFNLQSTDDPQQFDSMFHVIFKMCDKSGIFKRKDNKLDLGEFTRIVEAFPTDLTMDITRLIGITLFNIIDKNRNGDISRSEMTAFLKNFNYDRKAIKNFMKALDEDKNGKISLDEFLLWFENQDQQEEEVYDE